MVTFEQTSGRGYEDLGMDQALLTVVSTAQTQLGLFQLSDQCYRCPYELAGSLSAGGNDTFLVDTRRGWKLAVISSDQNRLSSLPEDLRDEVCSLDANFGDRGSYHLNVTDTGCSLHTLVEPYNIHTPLLIFGIVLVTLAVVHGFCSCAYMWFRGRLNSDSAEQIADDELPTKVSDEKPKAPPKSRMVALDVFRGITILLMIFVNEWEGQYWFFQHAAWNGLLVADLVFPWFMWIMGACIPLALASQLRRGKSTLRIIYHIVKRSWWLFLIGIVLNSLGGHVAVETYRIPGVLQRFACTYLVIALSTLPAMLRKPKLPEGGVAAAVYDVTSILPQWIIALAIVAGHSAITFLLPVPGCPTGYLGPGGSYNNATVPGSCVGGAAGYIDRMLIGEEHIYQNPTAKEVYGSAAFDPEGILGVMMSCFSVFLGVQAGMTMYLYKDWWSRVKRWMFWCVITGAIGAALCGGAQEGGVIPINKNLWSLSYTLVTACFAFFLLIVCYISVDVLKWWSGSPFFYPGRNALLMYVGHMVTYNLFPFHWKYGDMPGHVWHLGEALWVVLCWLVISIWMHQKRYFWKL